MRFVWAIVVANLGLMAVGDSASAGVSLSFGGETWDQDNSPNIGVQLGVDDNTTRSGASFGPLDNPPANLSRTSNITGFVEGTPGANTGVGYLSRITARKNNDPTPGPLEATGTRAVNIPQAANINASIIRRGIQVGWLPGTNGLPVPVLADGTGDDFIIWESGNANEPDALMVRVRNAETQLFTDWYFEAPTQHAAANATLFKFSFDIFDLGLAAGTQIDLIELANMVTTDRIDPPGTNGANGWVAEGRVRPEAGGAFGENNPGPDPGPGILYGVPFGNSTYDPDPLYVSILPNLQQLNMNGTAVPEASSLAIWSILGVTAVGASWLRRRRAM